MLVIIQNMKTTCDMKRDKDMYVPLKALEKYYKLFLNFL